MKHVLYISYDGMTDPLGQSQVMPYIIGLSKEGYSFTVISCEKKERFVQNKEQILKLCRDNGISWQPITYTKTPPVLSTLWDIQKIKRRASQLHRRQNYDIIHCRSYIASLVGLWMNRKYKIPFIFDMRGFWADERVEGELWNLGNPIYRHVYGFFKKREKQFLEKSAYTISLTQSGKEELLQWKHMSGQPIPIEIIPCCVDLDYFNPNIIDADEQKRWRNKLGIKSDDFILTYLGSIGTWYMLSEMLDFYSQLLRYHNAKFLFITTEEPKIIYEEASKRQLNLQNIIIQKASRKDVPTLLSLSSWGIFFIKPVFSKKASSPVKQGEFMAMGVPVICNKNIGDTEHIIKKSESGICVKDFSIKSYEEIIEAFNYFSNTREVISSRTQEFFSIEKGIDSYSKVYQKVLE